MQISTQSKQVIQLASEDFFKALHEYLVNNGINISYEAVADMRIVKSRSEITGTLEFETKSVVNTEDGIPKDLIHEGFAEAVDTAAQEPAVEAKQATTPKPVAVETTPEQETADTGEGDEEGVDASDDVALAALDAGKIPDVTKTTEAVEPAGGRVAKPLFEQFQ